MGREPDPLPRNGTNWANLMVNNVFPCPGRVIAWEYYRLIPVGEAYVGVWRQTDASEFELRGSTLLPPARVGRQIVEVPYPIDVYDGDFVGIYYPRNTPNNVIASATLADDTVPAMELYQNYYIQMYSDMIREGVPFDINRVPSSVTNATFSIRALMDYAGIGPTGESPYRAEFGFNTLLKHVFLPFDEKTKIQFLKKLLLRDKLTPSERKYFICRGKF